MWKWLELSHSEQGTVNYSIDHSVVAPILKPKYRVHQLATNWGLDQLTLQLLNA